MITVSNLYVTAGAFSLRGVNFEVPAGQYAVLMGKTGCGKTTVLEALCGLRRVDSGSITLSGRDVTHLKPAERGIGYVPQDRALFSTMSVAGHLSFALEIRRWPREKITQRVQELSALLGITHLLGRYPQGLSGGESQRVALGRALSFFPHLLILDEPLSALDEETRGEMVSLLKRVRAQTGVTALHVTHDRREAADLADRVLVIADGRISERAPASAAAAPVNAAL